jgi:antitoxin YefM
MTITYTQARANLKALLDEVSDSREPVIIRRRGGEDVALIAVDELRSLIETAHLLRSPKNAERLLKALAVVYGIEPMVILKDICGANDRETEAVVRWMMDALVDAALRDTR